MYNFLNSNRIGEVLDSKIPYWKNKREKNIITVNENVPIRDAMEILAKNNILSLPVIDKQGEYLGMVDIVDIIHAILYHYLALNDLSSKDSLMDDKIWDTLCTKYEYSPEGRDFIKQPISKIINQSKKDLFIPVDFNGTMYQLIHDVFRKDIHRVVVVDENAQTRGLISQTDILQYLLENMNQIKEDIDVTVGSIPHLIDSRVVSMHGDTIAMKAYYLMLKTGTYGVAVLDKSDQIINDLSIADLRGMEPQSFFLLLKPSIEFSKNKEILKCTRDTPLREVMDMLSKNRAHRVWVVESKSNNKPIGIISIGHVMKYFGKAPDAPSILSTSTNACETNPKYHKINSPTLKSL